MTHKTAELPAPVPAADSRKQIALMVTRRCNMTCAHCSVASSPSITNEPGEEELIRTVDEIIEAGVKAIQFTGGEPMLRETLVLDLMKRARDHGVQSLMTSNGFWGKDALEAEIKLAALRKSGMIQLTISYDPFHEQFLPVESVKNIARAAENQGFVIQVNLTRLKNDRDLDPIAKSFEDIGSVQLRFYDVQPVGRAKQFDDDAFRSSIEGFCNACERAAISDDGRMMACNGPAYFSRKDSALIVGSLTDHKVGELLDLHAADPVLQTIRTKGPIYLKTTLEQLPEAAGFPFRDQYHGLCDLCLHITSDAEALAALRKKLSTPREQAQRESLRLLINRQRASGDFNRTYVNRAGITKILLDASIPGRLPGAAALRSHLLPRPDLDWRQVLATVTGNGLARPLLAFFGSPDVKALAPAFVQTGIERSAVAESLKLVEVQKVLRTIAECLDESQTEAVLLKGGALVLQSIIDGEKIPCKTPGDIDLYIPPDKAFEVRDRLLQRGFTGFAGDVASHHLPSVMKGRIPVEIHVRIMRKFYRLPESEMLAEAVPVPGWEPFKVLSTEAFLLHTAVHTASENYTHGLKTFWGQLYAIDRTGPDQIDWDLLLRWIAESRCPRCFWVPFQIACRQLAFPVPEDFVSHCPRDKRQNLLLRYASNRIFATMSHVDSGFILRKFPHDLLLTDSPGPALRLILSEFSIEGIVRRAHYIKRLGWKRYLGMKRQLFAGYLRMMVARLKSKRQ